MYLGGKMRYIDGLGHEYDVPESCIAEFERRRGVLLRIAIVIKFVILAALIWHGLS